VFYLIIVVTCTNILSGSSRTKLLYIYHVSDLLMHKLIN